MHSAFDGCGRGTRYECEISRSISMYAVFARSTVLAASSFSIQMRRPWRTGFRNTGLHAAGYAGSNDGLASFNASSSSRMALKRQ